MDMTMGRDIDSTSGRIFFSFMNVCSIILFLLRLELFPQNNGPGIHACMPGYPAAASGYLASNIKIPHKCMHAIVWRKKITL